MTSTNLDLVRSLYTAWEKGDFRSPTDWADPEIEFVSADGPTPGKWKGPAGLEEGWRDFLGAWEKFRIGVDEGKGSGLELGHVGTNGAALFHVRGGKVTRFVFWLKREHAFADLDLG